MNPKEKISKVNRCTALAIVIVVMHLFDVIRRSKGFKLWVLRVTTCQEMIAIGTALC
jgi:hypothetical protein